MSSAEIHVLPTMGLSTPQVSRIVTELAEAHAAGVDLGSRVPHIQANSDALLVLHHNLERELAGLGSALEQLGGRGRHAGAVLQQLLEAVRQLADMARHHPH
ncbi:hypothetical protein [Methylorubrum extorquens]|jgi:hypothetical protein|uniref:Uncharacterized protein n=1 Tax=Methylorubrum extorquens TaxID=408 RepID=A0AAX3WHC3_METEX|nr:hypothetical protein [Methylorubrum extorquens]ABY28567.1 hypothetical protein Mext_0140 [Methylorubrum extorquens PA1]KQP93104.1 hypothetical protein ASF55_20650 [Methylobacterium sp. Leaf119]WHQ70191.1 hypothetical protein KEC54_00485 [Methylorubrum extorquens]WIU39950.1 hypothetical protein KQ926_00730 [Methylorubrum extorquens]